jgi:mono/diheme cytochrome c family protein
MSKQLNEALKVVWLVICLGLLAGCTLNMRTQPRLDPFEESTLFEDHSSARPGIAGVVSRDSPQLNPHLYRGQLNGEFAQTFPFTVTQQVLERGRERYDIFCSPCHGYVGDGQGIVVEYGMRQPASFHDPELRAEPAGYYFDLITNGTRVMPSYAARIQPDDRWAIVAYIRALQLSQQADPAQVPPQEAPNLK